MEAVPEPRVSKGQSRCLSGAGWVQGDSRHSLTVSHQQPGLTGGRTSLGNVGCVDTDLRLHLSLLFPLVLIFPKNLPSQSISLALFRCWLLNLDI